MSRFLKKLGKQIQEKAGDFIQERTSGHEHMPSPAEHVETHSTTSGGRMLRGDLHIEVTAARDLPDTDNKFFNIGKLLDKKDVTDSYVAAYLDTCRILMTSVKDNNLNPVWKERFFIPVCHRTHSLVFKVRDKDHLSSDDIGQVEISFDSLQNGEVSGWHDIINSEGGVSGELLVSVHFVNGYTASKEYGVDSYFPVRSGCYVTLYSCARNSPTPVILSDGEEYQPRSCYLDMFKAIVSAEKFIYITGWSVWTGLQLVRGEDALSLYSHQEQEMSGLTVGELLLRKASEGVKVLIMVWSEFTSGAVVGEKGMMGTHDMETFNFFKGTPVECCLVPREVGRQELSDVLNHQVAAASYTHHQKSIILDSPPDDGSLKNLVAFVGGLDITDGRYDTPEHPLFSTITTIHREDFYQNSAPNIKPTEGPRQPWQDIHSRVEGPVAWDVLQNFTDRWNKQARGRSGNLYTISQAEFDTEARPGNWNVQFLRSITDDSAIFGNELRHHTLTVKKSRKYEESIAKAYIAAIRSAQAFIYLENQYFLGSAYAWEKDNQTNCHHTIPAEIAEKIVEKIKEGREFKVYIVIPMHPEGDPSTIALQEILAWQRRTMEMMYRRVAQALQKVGSARHPTDYLQFLCLANRECEDDLPAGLDTPESGSKAELLRETKRFMIYVHSKLLIVDDSLAIVGSANINQRSMAGSRDTEMAVSLHQEGETLLQQGTLPRGEVARFRLRLWEEHLGFQGHQLLEPNTQDCMDFVKSVTQSNWQAYTLPGEMRLPGHALPYPVSVSVEGRVGELDGFPHLPDTTAPVQGTKSNVLPIKLTT